MDLVDAQPTDIPVPSGVTVEFEKNNGSLKRVVFKEGSRVMCVIHNPATYDSLKVYKPAPPKREKRWVVEAVNGSVSLCENFEFEHQAQTFINGFTSDWKTALAEKEIELSAAD